MAITGSLQEKNGRYHLVLNVPTLDGKTKQKWESTGLPVRGNKKQAAKILTERLAQLNKYKVPYYKITVAEYFKEWLKQIEKEARPNTYRSYYGNMTNHIIPYFEQRKILLQDLKPFHLEDFYKSKLQANSKIKSGEALSPVTIKHFHQNISKALSDAARRGIIYVNPATAAKTPKAEKFKAKFLDAKQLQELLTLFKGNTIELPVMLCAIYGFRRSEVLGLKWNNIDFDKRTITVSETLQQHTGGEYTDKPKTESSHRTLPMTDSVYAVLKAHRQLQNDRKIIMGNYYTQNDYVCTWANGEVIKPNYLTSTFHSIVSKSNLPQIRLHDLRHSVASNLISEGVKAGISIVDIQEWLGHANASTTLDVYSHAAKSSKENIASTLEQIIPIDGTTQS